MEYENSIVVLIVVVLGPTIFIFKSFVQNTGNYLSSILELSTRTESYTVLTWQNVWTVFTGMVDCMVAFVGCLLLNFQRTYST
jgi:hypothetical protein